MSILGTPSVHWTGTYNRKSGICSSIIKSPTCSKGYGNPLDGPTEVGTGIVREPKILLSNLIEKLNDRFGTDFNQADQLFFDQLVETAIRAENIKKAAEVNPQDKFTLIFKNLLQTLFAERIDQNEEIFARFMNDAAFQKLVTGWLASEAYRKIREG